MNESELLRRFADVHDKEAFAELVRGKVNLVYAAALRQVGGDAHLAQDVTQDVFIALACHAARLVRHPVLTGWLYTTTRNLAAKSVRDRRRWQRREADATTMNLEASNDEAAWHELRPVLDEAMHELGAHDRAALLLRFFEGRSQAEVGTALGLSENAARMRIDRALEKLRQRLSRRGITSTAAALGAGLASESLLAAPAGLASSVSATALSCAAAGAAAVASGTAVAALGFMSTTKVILGTAGAVALFGVGALVGGGRFHAGQPEADLAVAEVRSENAALRRENEQWHARVRQAEAARTARDPVSTAVAPGPADAIAATGKWKLMAELHRSKLLKGPLTFIDKAGRLNESVASLFDLTPSEQKALSHLVDRTREQMEQLELRNATITRPAENVIAIEVKPFPAEGGAVYDALTKGIAETLGQERNAAFVTLGGEELERSLAMFGAADRTVTVTSQPMSDHSRYLARDVLLSGGNRYNNGRNFATREALTEYLGTIAKLLPPEF